MSQQLYENGTILTMDEQHGLYAEALLVKDGTIAAVGGRAQVEALSDDARKVDLAGRTLMPAFIDPHSHLSNYATALQQVPLEEARSYDELVDKIKAFIHEKGIPAGQWVTAKGYDHNQLAEGCPPDRQVLDRAAPENPLVLQHKSGHTGVFNTQALRELGVTADTPDPAGGKIGRAQGQLTGYMEENAFVNYLQRVPLPSPQDLLALYTKAQQCYASQGITTVQDGMVVDVMVPLYRFLLEKDALFLDTVAYADLRDCETFLDTFHDHIDQYKQHFKIGGYKTFLDGSPQARTAWMRTPYKNAEDGYRGYPTLTDEQLLTHIRRALREGRQLLAHCNGDAAAQQYLDMFTKALGELDDAPDIRPVMIHAQLLDRDQLPRLREIGMIPSFFVGHVYHWGDVHIRNFGPARAARISCAASALKEHILFTFHQDAPVIEPDMLETVWCAVNRLTKAGVPLGPEERISPLEALKAVTVNAAYQYFEERQKGTLEPGKLADLVILSDDPLRVDPMAIRDIQVLETIKRGETIYQAE